MKALALLDKFDQISEAPDALVRIRQFILDLAVRGMLVEQVSGDEPVSDLLIRIQEAKNNLINSGVVRRPRQLNSLDLDDVPFEIPASWQWQRLGDIGSIVGGGTPPSNDENCFVEGGHGIAWLTPADLGNHTNLHISHGRRDLTEHGLESSSAQLMPAGSVLFSSRAPIGYTAIAENSISTNQGFKSVIPYVPEMNRHIALFFRAFVPWIQKNASGTTFKEVSGKVVSNLPFPLPPIAEQHRIDAKVDELMAICDELEAAQQEREEHRDHLVNAILHRMNNGKSEVSDDFKGDIRFYLDHLPHLAVRPIHVVQLRKTVLNLAVRGWLVEQDPEDETADALLTRIDEERTEISRGDRRAKATTQELLGSELCWDIPSNWTWRGVADLMLFVDYRGKTPPKSEKGIRLITAKNIRKGFIQLFPEEFVSKSTYRSWMTRGFPKVGDILFTTEAPMGNAAVIDIEEKFAIAQRAICFQLYGGIDPKFVTYQLLSPLFQELIDFAATGLTAKGIKSAKLKRLPFVVPPIGEQKRIAAKVGQLMVICDELEASISTASEARSVLLEAAAHEALAPP